MIKRLRIGVDCDNILNNLSESVLNVYNEESGDNLRVEDIVAYKIENFVKAEYKYDFNRFFHDKRVWKGINVVEGCVDVLRKWNVQGYELYIVTATDTENMTKKGAWLQKILPFIYMNTQMICLNKKQLLGGNIDVLIDDCLDNLIDGDYKRIVLDYPWNRGVNDKALGLIRCKNWDDIEKEVERISEERGM